MALKRRGAGFFLLLIIGGALLGSALGEFVGYLLPSGVVRDFFTKAVMPGLNPPVTVNLLVMTITIGFSLNLNIISILGVVLMAYLMRWL